MKKLLLLIILANLILVGYSQTTEAEKNLKIQSKDSLEGWKKGGTVSLNLTQVSLTNWSAGGQNSISGNGLVSLFAHYKKGVNSWENYLDLAYGTLKQGKNDNWWKTDDKINFTSKYGRKAFSNWYYAGLLNFNTQMTDGFNYPNDSTVISGLMAPGYVLGAVGLDYKPIDNFTVFISPFTSKFTIVTNQTLADAGAFGVEQAVIDPSTGNIIKAGLNTRSEIGGYIRIYYKKDVTKNIGIQTKVDLFANYQNNPQNIDVSWEVLVSMKVNKYISATISTHLLYDDDIDIAVDNNDDGIVDKFGPRTQFKEVIGVGLSYKF
ncbi:MAG: DUF3078 domain-containing protein [Bacteroidetes bacterium]|nr:DUF3078 domain-containing protein [Bacteroidota bacterium]